MKRIILAILVISSTLVYSADWSHPNMLLTKSNIPAIRKQVNQLPMLAKAFEALKLNADLALIKAFDAPVPKGKGGSYSHTTHLDNASAFLDCGIVYQITGNEKYARFVIDGLKVYASKYKTFGKHPNCTQHYPGVLFFQELNENVWMVRVAQAYDCVFEKLTAEERNLIENELFAPMVAWASVENKRTFNYMHNHATWGTAAVGMLGYVTGRDEWIKMALYGTKEDGSGGFLKQLESLFSPEGYYDEGPYYHRYALMPFVVFANVINNYEPERKIFEYRNAVLRKAVDAIIQLSVPGGMLFHFNDADKDAAITDEGIVYAVNIAYSAMGKNPGLLNIAARQGVVTLTDAGFNVARDLQLKKASPFEYKTTWFGDGSDGTHGGVAVLREGKGSLMQTAVLKASSQGQGHGHYDRLNLLWYDGETEVFGDYGFARYVDIESKRGGEYLPENASFAKQTVIHNTLTVDQKSDFEANYTASTKYHPEKLFFVQNSQLSAASAIEANAFPGVKMIRTVALIRFEEQDAPVLFDLYKTISDSTHLYELPYWYNGQLVNLPFKTNFRTDTLTKAGNAYGYQHLWLTGESGTFDGNSSFFTFLKNNRYYTSTFATDTDLRLKFVMAGASDPEHSLRNEKAVLFSGKSTGNHIFCTTTESHDYKNNAVRNISDLKVSESAENEDIITLKYTDYPYKIIINYRQGSAGIKVIKQ